MKTKLKDQDTRLARTTKYISETLVPLSAKAGNQRHIAAIRDGFALFTSFSLVFAVGIMFITVIFGGWSTTKISLLGQIANWCGGIDKHYSVLTSSANVDWTFVAGSSWETASNLGVKFFSMLTDMTVNYMSLYIALFIGFFYGISARYDTPLIPGVISMIAAYFSSKGVVGAEGLFTSIIVSLFTSTLYCRLVKIERLTIKLPDAIPPIVAKSMGLFTIVFLTLGIVAGINFSLSLIFAFSISDVHGHPYSYHGDNAFYVQQYIYRFLQAPFSKLAESDAGNITILILYVAVGHFGMFFGVHGNATVVPFLTPLLIILWIQNLNGGTNAATGDTINAFILIGGMAYLPMLSLILILSRKRANKYSEVAKFAILPDFFQISEPTWFGLPVLFNFKFFIPLVFGSIGACIIVWLWISVFHWCPPAVIPIPWTTPIFISGLIATKFAWQSIILTIVMFGYWLVVYAPFVIHALRTEWKHDKDEAATKKEAAKIGA